MKNFLKILAFTLLFIGFTSPNEAQILPFFDNPAIECTQESAKVCIVSQVVEASRTVAEFVQYHNPFSEHKNDAAPVMGLVALVGIRRKSGPKPGGNKRLYLCPIDQLQDVEFPTYADAVAGEIITPIPLILTPTPQKFTEIQAAYDTTKWGFSSKGKSGNQSFEQNVSFDIYGIDKDSISLVAKLLNRPCVIIARGNNNTNYFVGSIDTPLEFEIQSDSGAKGSDPQKITFAAKNDGLMFPVIPLGTAATFAVEPLPALA